MHCGSSTPPIHQWRQYTQTNTVRLSRTYPTTDNLIPTLTPQLLCSKSSSTRDMLGHALIRPYSPSILVVRLFTLGKRAATYNGFFASLIRATANLHNASWSTLMGWYTEIIRQAEAAATDIQDGPS